MDSIPLQHIFLFMDVFQTLSFSQTAKKHRLTPASVSKRITQLENELNTTLLIRSTRKLVPTESGIELFKHCQKIYLDSKEAIAKTADKHNQPLGNITISAPTNFSNLILSKIVSQFREKHPDITFTLLIDDTRKKPEVGDCDIAIRAGKLKDSNFKAKKLFTLSFVYCASPKYLKKHGEPKSPADLKHHNLVEYNYREEGYIWTFFKNKKRINQPITPTIVSNSGLCALKCVYNHAGITCAPGFIINKDLKNKKLAAVLTQYDTLKQDVWALHPYGQTHMPKKIELFLDFLYKHIDKTLKQL